MNTLIIYDTAFGNTAQLARAIADTLRVHSTVRIARVDEADSCELKETDLLVMGGPTQRHRLSPALRAFLDRFPRRSLPGLSAAAFDTRYHMSTWKSGSAAHEIARRLKRIGASLIVLPESFFVVERGPLRGGRTRACSALGS
jgi:menaquinone-dependent protoporphyrinogen IX oxidase